MKCKRSAVLVKQQTIERRQSWFIIFGFTDTEHYYIIISYVDLEFQNNQDSLGKCGEHDEIGRILLVKLKRYPGKLRYALNEFRWIEVAVCLL